MKRFFLIAIALCFVFAGNIESFGQTKKTTKKPVRKKLVKCYENGKRVYRTKCRTPKITNPTLPQIQTTTKEKTKENEKTRYGLSDGIGNGQGSGGGQGSGIGRGYGGGVGNGTGNNNTTEQTTPKIPNSNGLTTPLRIISKPRPAYTDAARQNNVQGTISLRVTFLANGAIGAISPVNGLPFGLTEQAVTAAKRISFQPAKRNGVPYNTTKIIQYTFVIY